ncbi:MAG: toxic anion resistance protein [Erysipelotrichaceae bacterium]|nr:toxic anion resistance protein [Erysipelotrichaceae bacterium]
MSEAKQEQKITLTLTPDEKKEENQAILNSLEGEKKEETPYVPQFDESILSDEEKKMVDDFSKTIDISSSTVILQYGSEAQKKISNFSDTALQNVRSKDLGEIGGLLSNLVTELQEFNEDEKEDGILGIFKKGTNKVMGLKAKYDKAEVNVNKICKVLEDHQVTLLKDIALLDELYERNQVNFKELSMYIMAGYKKLEEVKNHDLKELVEKAEKSGLPEDSQAANDLANACDRFEKKLHDLELTRVISIQMAPQIRLVQNNDTLMTEKIQSTLVNTIPLWKSQMVLALGVNHSKEAMEAQREVTNMTNTLLKKNAETLHMATVETAKESERGIVDLETLTHTNEQLIQTLDEVLKIQKEGHEKRKAAQEELAKIEAQLNKKLLEINK